KESLTPALRCSGSPGCRMRTSAVFTGCVQWNQAVRVCIACISDEMEPEEARKAFLAAAKEEGLVLRSSD
ncbi:DUF982 domain-containing protein, partial [Mesorhizobium sp. M0323]|uniref:DUF982 domain-containing protein n=1 Tax=Mesorhizobium sp. M0323 TaxID=2956938 RepID=UPI00333558C8